MRSLEAKLEFACCTSLGGSDPHNFLAKRAVVFMGPSALRLSPPSGSEVGEISGGSPPCVRDLVLTSLPTSSLSVPSHYALYTLHALLLLPLTEPSA